METSGSVPLRRLPSYTQHETPEHTGHDSSSESSPLHDDELPSYSQARSTGQISGGHSTLLHRSAWVFFFTIFYVALAIYAWTMTVLLSSGPVKAKSWGYSIKESYLSYGDRNQADFRQDRQIYRSARIIQTFIQVVTLPWISTVCASAAVIFAQNRKDSMSLRLRQVTTLADRRWMDFSLYRALICGRWRQYGSILLAAAIFIWVFGLITYPIQALFLDSSPVKVRTYPQQRAAVYDFISNDDLYLQSEPDGKDVLNVRDALNKANGDAYQPNLWSNNSGVQFLTLNDMSPKTFYSQVPSGFNTGLLRQFAPRVNSTATYQIIQESEIPVACDTGYSLPVKFYAGYSSSYSWYSTYSWSVIACMPGDMTSSPWRAGRTRQDFSEVLYLNMTQEEYTSGGYSSQDAGNKVLYRITVDTTAGFFELPNYMNKGVPGPLLDQDPLDLCGQDCIKQDTLHTFPGGSSLRRRDENTASSALKDASLSSISTEKKGPLLAATLATFGPGSFVDTFVAVSAALEADDKITDEVSSNLRFTCIANAPLANLFNSSSFGSSYSGCITPRIAGNGTWYSAESQIAKWIHLFQEGTDSISSAFTAAAYLANQEFISSQSGIWYINQDLGTDMDLPSISPAGIIVVSILMGLYLLPLLALSLYAGYYPRWTERLDSFVMLRFGAFAGDKVFPMLVGRHTEKCPELDEMSGVVRDVSTTSADGAVQIGRLGFGEGKMLQEGRRYECFKGDNEPFNSWFVEHRG
ncbi:hypothetical protein N7517_002081 [Penicillium concentricum]|uniref:Uncharacterized protein n=1 Tax=Penicillium concentricum TaxID=293559 RepID=A0A9W9STB7_9EURO|nr:uncharacterized protein N7517_002081 [Penicillium concentricum]KAJ5384170.1 hypothetical protein N7517_002081 [Penicillium concentricum]